MLAPAQDFVQGVLQGNCTFHNNIATPLDDYHNNSLGGAVYVAAEATLNASGCIFEANNASYGAALFLAADLSANSSLTGLQFLRNHAAIGGGGLFVTLSAPCIPLPCAAQGDGCYFDGNTAVYGDNISSNAAKIELLPPYNRTDLKIPTWPGMSLSVSLQMVDYYGNSVIRNDTLMGMAAVLSNSSSLSFRSQKGSVPADENGRYAFLEAYVTGRTMQNYSLVFATHPDNPTDPTLNLTQCLALMSCPPTMYIPNATAPQDADTTCMRCSYDRYNFDGSACEPCPAPAECLRLSDESTRELTIPRGFWPNSFTDASGLWACPYGPETCNGSFVCHFDPVFGSWTWNVTCGCPPNSSTTHPDYCACAKGSHGRLCTKCSCDGEGDCYFYMHRNYCEECRRGSTAVIVVSVVVLCAGFLVFVLLKRANVTLFVGGAMILMALQLAGVGRMYLVDVTLVLLLLFLLANGGIPSGLVKSFLFYLQMLNFIYDGRAWPDWLRQAAKSLDYVNFRIGDVTCLGVGFLREPIGEFAFFMVLPFILVALTAALLVSRWAVQALLAKAWRLAPWHSRGVAQREEGEEEEGGTSGGGTYRRINDASTRSNDEEEDDPTGSLLRQGSMVEEEEEEGSQDEDVHLLLAEAKKNARATEGWRERKHKLIASALFVVYAVHFRLSKVVLAKFEPCQEGYMAEYLWIKCHTEERQYAALLALAIFFLLAFVLGIPALFGALLFHYRNAIRGSKNVAVEECLGFVYKNFRADLFWWEMAWFARRVLLVLALTVVPEDNAFHAPLVIALLAVALGVHHLLRPMRHDVENAMEGLSLLALLLTYAASLRTYDASASTGGRLADTQPLESVILALNACVCLAFVALLCWPALKAVHARVRPLLPIPASASYKKME